MNRRLWWVLVAVLAFSMTLFTACDTLLNPEEDTPEDAQIDAALVGTWVTYSTDAEIPEGVDYYSGVRLNSDGTGTTVGIADNGVSTPDIELTSFTWSAESGQLQINQISPSVDTLQMAYTLSQGNNVVTVVGTNGDGTGQSTLVKFQPNHDTSLVGKWLVEAPTEDAGAIIQLNSDGSGSYTEPSSDIPDDFEWGTNSGYIGILTYQDIAGFVASYTVTAESATLTFSDGTMTLSKIDTSGGGGGGTIDEDLVGTWLFYASSNMSDTSGYDGEHYATLTLRDDGTGSHVSVYEEYDMEDPVIETTSFTYSVSNDSIYVNFINPPDDMPDSFVLTFALLESNNKLMLYGADGEGSEDTYIRYAENYDPDVLGTWYIVMPYEDLDAELVFNSDGSGSYTNAVGGEQELFTWGTNAGYIGILLYGNVGFVGAYEIDGDNMTFNTPFGSMELSRTSSGTGGSGVVVPELVGDYVLYSSEYPDDPSSSATPSIKRIKSKISSTSGIDYVEGVSMSLNSDGTGAYYFAWDFDNEGPIDIEGVPFTWGEVADGYLRFTFDESDTTYGGESWVIPYTFLDDELVFNFGYDEYWSIETYYRVSDNRPSMYYGTFFFQREILNPPINEYYNYGDFKMTLILEADGGTLFRHEYGWDEENQTDYWYDVTENFNWSVTADGQHFVQYDPVTHMGRAVTFTFTEVDNSARLESSMYRWEWDNDNQEPVLVEAISIFYRYSGLNDADLNGDWVAAEYFNDMGEHQGVPTVNIILNSSDGSGTSMEMDWDDDLGEEVYHESTFHWYNADGMVIVMDDVDLSPGDPFYGQVMPYVLEGDGLSIDVPDMQYGTPAMIFFARDTGALDANIYGDWVQVEVYENDMSVSPDPNGALFLGDDGRGSYTHTDENDGTTPVTEDFGYSTSATNVGSYIIIDMDEPVGDPELALRQAYEYMYATTDGRLHIFTKMYDEWGGTTIYHEIYARPE